MRLTLALYVARRFLTMAVAVFATVFALVVLITLIELLRANDAGEADFPTLLAMAVLRAPSVTITAAPFTVLLAAMATFATLARHSELVVTRAAGVSIWRLLLPAVAVAMVMGVVAFAVYNPLAAAFAGRFGTLEERYLGRSSSALSVAAGGIWLRQGGAEGQTVIRAQRAAETVDQLWRVTMFRFGPGDRLETRIDAARAVLGQGEWRLFDVRRWRLDAAARAGEPAAETLSRLTLTTNLTPAQIQESFAAPETIPFWDLPGFIELLEDSGFSSSRHRLHWHALLAAPVVYAAMVLFGAAFSTRHARFGGLGWLALGCVLTGFAYFFLSDVAQALGASGAVPAGLAAWGPPVAAILLASGLILHLEDG